MTGSEHAANDGTIYFDDAAFKAAWRVFRDTDGTEADCLRAALEAAAPHIAAADWAACDQETQP